VLLPLAELERRTGQWRVQHQVSFRNDLTAQDVRDLHQLVLFGLESDLEIESADSSTDDAPSE
jgi:hypothetical protein